ncbi:hypothetical protein ACSBR1_040012 [Camellia fascicularis]
MAESAVDLLLENLKQIMKLRADLHQYEEDQIGSLNEELRKLKALKNDMDEKKSYHHNYQHEKMENLVTHINRVACKAKGVVEFFMANTRKLGGVAEDIKSIKVEMTDIRHKMNDLDVIHHVGTGASSNEGVPVPSKPNRTVVGDEIMVGFDDEAMAIKEQLIGGKKQRDVISIIGMAGLGKTTLSKKVYNDPYIVHHFHIRAWACVSQVYRKKDLLLDILGSVVQLRDEIYEMSVEKLGVQLYKGLKGKRYLVFVDDIWSIEDWDDFKIFFPDDHNGSRVMLTSRLMEVALHVKPNNRPHCLRFLTEEESWKLLHEKVFHKDSCPPELIEIGKQITIKCRGLPLAIVVIAGLLAKTEKSQDQWKQVAQSVSSYIVSDPKQYMDTLALSYNHLPQHLKPCFLYFGAFLEDREIPVQKLIWLWIAEGFIKENGQKQLEDIAEDYLKELVERSLVIVVQKRSSGGIKACHVHSLLRDLCLRKAQEVNFLEQICEAKQVSSSSSSSDGGNNQHRLCIHPDFLNFCHNSMNPNAEAVQSFLCFHNFDSNRQVVDLQLVNLRMRLSLLGECYGDFGGQLTLLQPIFSHPSLQLSILTNNLHVDPWSFIYQTFKLVTVLALWCPNVFFSHQILRLVHLRYLAIQSDDFYVLPPSISNLFNLETLILGSRWSNITLPPNVLEMAKLRHLSTRGKYHIDSRSFVEASLSNCSSFTLYNLQTISYLCPCEPAQDFLAKTPNIRKLGFSGHLISESRHLMFPNLDLLSELENLKLCNTAKAWATNLHRVKFPANIRKLTLRETEIEWEEISTIGMLPNLEVLKLEMYACWGPRWETTDGGFCRLKFLKFKHLSVERWIASGSHFPRLEHLVLENCSRLKEIPSGLGDILTLQMIEVTLCTHFAEESAKKIKKEQKSNGNDWLKILINNQEYSGITCESVN